MNFFARLRDALYRFMYGRNGVDALSWAMVVCELVLALLASLLRINALTAIVNVLTWVLWVLVLFRMFSRNLTKRRAENARFLSWWNPIAADLRGAKARRADKAHKYVKCSCGAWCRVPRGVGRVELKCPKCGKKHTVKT